MRILFTGSRTWDDVDTFVSAATLCVRESGASKEDVVFVHGACPRGADALAQWLAEQWGVSVESYPAEWDVHGRSAGFVRNAQMVQLGADICLAFIRDSSRGASHTASLAEKSGIPTRIFRYN